MCWYYQAACNLLSNNHLWSERLISSFTAGTIMVSFPDRLLNDDKPVLSLSFNLGETSLLKFWDFKIPFLINVRK